MSPRLTNIDIGVIVFYFVFMTLMSWVFKRFIKNTSDYFRGGGEMLWWMAGAGAFMVSFSAVTFTGMAGKAYSDGPVVMVIFIGNALGFLINYLWFAPISRQTRAITAMQVVRTRFGRVSEQFFTWLQIPVQTFYAGLWLMGLSVFVSAGFGWDLDWTIALTGGVVLIMALVGGSWSVMAGDFVQMLILMPVTIVAAVLALSRVGGVSGFAQKVPAHFAHWGAVADVRMITLWVVATLLQKFVSTNSMQDCSRYLAVKDSKHARWAAMLGTVLFVIGPIVWFIPPMVARITHPDIREVFPKLDNPQEAAFFAISIATMPAGMVGLLLSGIFGATMSSMDGGLNKNAGFFVKNFWQVYVHPKATERELLLTSKISTLVLGILIILAGWMFAHWKNLTIFEMMTYFSSLVGLPVAIPLVLGMLNKKAPAWAGWSTVLVGLVASLVSNRLLSAESVQHLLGAHWNKREASDWVFVAGAFTNIIVGCGWYFITCFFADARPVEEKQRVDELFQLMHKPVDFEKEEGAGSDNLQAKIMGTLCLIYGGFILLLMFLPNPIGGRLAFLFCGGVMAGVGALLRFAGTRGSRVRADVLPGGSLARPIGDVLAERDTGPGFEVVSGAQKKD